jgi:hypothetical protein
MDAIVGNPQPSSTPPHTRTLLYQSIATVIAAHRDRESRVRAGAIPLGYRAISIERPEQWSARLRH